MKVMIYSELEMLVREDMIKNGYDPDDSNSKLEYWKERLS
jgi:hypothetical protein